MTNKVIHLNVVVDFDHWKTSNSLSFQSVLFCWPVREPVEDFLCQHFPEFRTSASIQVLLVFIFVGISFEFLRCSLTLPWFDFWGIQMLASWPDWCNLSNGRVFRHNMGPWFSCIEGLYRFDPTKFSYTDTLKFRILLSLYLLFEHLLLLSLLASEYFDGIGQSRKWVLVI